MIQYVANFWVREDLMEYLCSLVHPKEKSDHLYKGKYAPHSQSQLPTAPLSFPHSHQVPLSPPKPPSTPLASLSSPHPSSALIPDQPELGSSPRTYLAHWSCFFITVQKKHVLGMVSIYFN